MGHSNKKIIEHARSLVGSGDISKSIKYCSQNIKTIEHQTELGQFASRNSNLEKSGRSGVESQAEHRLAVNHLTSDFLHFLASIEEQISFQGIAFAMSRHKDVIKNKYSKYSGHGFEFSKQIVRSIEKSDDEKYNIAVIGFVKAGKSTLINTFINNTILPTNYLQETTNFIEISEGEKNQLLVEFYDGSVEDFVEQPDSVSLNVRLSQIAAVNDIYRDIPFLLINDYIVNSLLTDGKNKNDLLNNSTIKKLCELDDKGFPNFSNIPFDDFFTLVKNYISEYCNLKKIPKKIQLKTPLSILFKDVRIVDTPGLNAIGEISYLTNNILKKESEKRPDSVILVHNLTGSAEDTSFWNFFKSDIDNDLKKYCLLVLTHASELSPDGLDKKITEITKNFCNNGGDKKNIVVVDSICESVYQDLLKQPNQQDIEELLLKYEAEDKLISESKNSSYIQEKIKFADELAGKKSRGKVNDVLAEARSRGNFEEFIKKLEEIAKSAPLTRLKQLDDNIDREINLIEKEWNRELLSVINQKNGDILNEMKTLNKSILDIKTLFENFLIELKKNHLDSQWHYRLQSEYDDLKKYMKENCDTRKEHRKAYETFQGEINRISEDIVYGCKLNIENFIKNNNISIVPPSGTYFINSNSFDKLVDRLKDVDKDDHKYTRTVEDPNAGFLARLFGGGTKEVISTDYTSYAKELRKETLSVASSDIIYIKSMVQKQNQEIVDDFINKMNNYIDKKSNSLEELKKSASNLDNLIKRLEDKIQKAQKLKKEFTSQ